MDARHDHVVDTAHLIVGIVVVVVLEIAPRMPRLGALILTLPMVSILIFIWYGMKKDDVTKVSVLVRETLALVPPGPPFFVPLALAKSWGIGFWTALGSAW